MAIIYSYPVASAVEAGDLLIGTDITGKQTKNFSIGSIVAAGIPAHISGTTDTVPLFTGSNTIGDSIITQDSGANGVSIGGDVENNRKLKVHGHSSVDGNLYVTGDSSVYSIEVGQSRTTEGVAFLDLTGEIIPDDYGLRMIRYGGENAESAIIHTGTSNLRIRTENAADTVFENTKVGIGTNSPQRELDVNGGIIVRGQALADTLEVTTSAGILGELSMSGVINMSGNLINNVANPVAPQDAASKAYVDSQNTGQVSGTGTTNTLPIWSDGPNSVLSDSIISELANEITIDGDLRVGQNNTISGLLYSVAIGEDNMVLGNTAAAIGFNNAVEGNRCGALGANNIVTGGQVWATGDGNNVGIEKLNVGGNIVVSGFNNTVKSGNSCAVGSSNILTNTLEEQLVKTNFALGSSNTINDTTNGLALCFNNTIDNSDSCILGKSNTTSANDTYAVGKSNTLSSDDDYAFGLNNTLSGSADIAMALGHNNVLSGSQSYAFGRNLEDGGEDNTVIIGRYNTAPTATGRIVFGTGFSPTGRKNAIEIQAGTSAQSGLLFPALRLSNSYSNDAEAEAAGVEKGELYRSNNSVRINLNQNAQQSAINNEGFAYLTPQLLTASAGTSKNVNQNYNLVLLTWTGGNGIFTLNLPSATSNTNRLIRITTDGSLDAGAADKINITATGGQTIDGNPSFQISKRYEGLAVFSTGTEWIIIQAKA